jgi:hypothetical protein
LEYKNSSIQTDDDMVPLRLTKKGRAVVSNKQNKQAEKLQDPTMMTPH